MKKILILLAVAFNLQASKPPACMKTKTGEIVFVEHGHTPVDACKQYYNCSDQLLDYFERYLKSEAQIMRLKRRVRFLERLRK